MELWGASAAVVIPGEGVWTGSSGEPTFEPIDG
jgi:hypothetical protein